MSSRRIPSTTPVFATMLATGAGISEGCALSVHDIDRRARYLGWIAGHGGGWARQGSCPMRTTGGVGLSVVALDMPPPEGYNRRLMK